MTDTRRMANDAYHCGYIFSDPEFNREWEVKDRREEAESILDDPLAHDKLEIEWANGVLAWYTEHTDNDQEA